MALVVFDYVLELLPCSLCLGLLQFLSISLLVGWILDVFSLVFCFPLWCSGLNGLCFW